MGKTIIQIYEVQKPKEAESLVDLGVDHIGSVLLSQKKWKSPAIRKTVEVIQRGKAKSGLIPLFKDPATIFQALDYYKPDFVHFCDALSPFPGDQAAVVREYDALLSLQLEIKDRFPQVDIMRSLSVPQPGQAHGDEILKNILTYARLLAPLSDYFLIDTIMGGHDAGQHQPVAGYVGITGETCDWDMAEAIIQWSPIPVILAGGISDQNAYEAVTRLKPAGIDSCTKTNAVDKAGQSIRFKKDLRKVKRLIEEVRRADHFEENGDLTECKNSSDGI